MIFEFMTIDTPLPPCMAFPRALTGFPVSSTAKIMYCRINEIMNQCISGWRYFPNPRMFSEYGRQKGWERENPATDSGNPSEKTMDGFVEVTEQMELPF